MTDTQRKMLTEWLGERWLTNQECIDSYASNRCFDTWQDVGDCKDKLVEKGLWDDFLNWICRKVVGIGYYSDSKSPLLTVFGVTWLFRPTDESGQPHFCRLVAEFLKALND